LQKRTAEIKRIIQNMKFKTEHFIIIGLFLYVLFLSMCKDPKIVTETVVERYSDTTITHDTVVKEIAKHHWHVPLEADRSVEGSVLRGLGPGNGSSA
jgi:hypothetical protein